MKKTIALLGLTLFSLLALGLSSIDKQELDDVNIIKNGGFENGLSRWTNVGAGTLGKITSGTNLLLGRASGSWDAIAASDTLTSSQEPIPALLLGRICQVKFSYKGGDTNIDAEVIDGSTNIIASWKLQNNATGLPIATTARTEVITFPCPSSGTLAFRLISTSNSAIIYLDSIIMGRIKTIDVSQAEIYGTANHVATVNCEWSNAPGGTFTSFALDADCPIPILTGEAAATATKIPAITFPRLEAGTYQVWASFRGRANLGAASDRCQYVISDGTATSQGASVAAQGDFETQNLEGVFEFPLGAENVTFQLQAKAIVGAPNCLVTANGGPGLHWVVKKYPGATQTIRALNSEHWLVDIEIGGSNPPLGGGPFASYTEISDPGLDLVQQPKSIPTKIACAGVELSQGATCAISESVGIVFDVPTAGSVMSCVTFPHLITVNVGAVNGGAETTFQQVLTSDGSQVILQEGGTKSYSHWNIHPQASGSDSRHTSSMHNCTVFNFSSAGSKTLRVMREQATPVNVTSNSLKLDRSVFTGQQALSWIIIPISNNFPAIQTINQSVYGTEAKQASSDVLSTTTSLIPVQKLKLTTGSLPAGLYRIGWHANYSMSGGGGGENVVVIIQQDDLTFLGRSEIRVREITNDEGYSGFAYVNLTNGVHFFDIDFHAISIITAVASIRDARLEIWRVQ